MAVQAADFAMDYALQGVVKMSLEDGLSPLHGEYDVSHDAFGWISRSEANELADVCTITPGLVARRGRDRSDDRVGRLFDLLVALTALIVLAPVLALLAVMILMVDPGPVFFVQYRVGRDGILFPCIKFRTMLVDAQARLETLLQNCPMSRAEWERDHKLKNDVRVTPLGRLMRKYSLDELPQLFNIVLGHMSVVGPRPIVEAEIWRYGLYFNDYSSVRPGLTGLWQVSGRNDVSYDERVQLDREYATRKSLAYDVSIVFRTVPAILAARGAY